MVKAYADLIRPRLVVRGEKARVAVIDHLLGRLPEAQSGVRATPLADIVDRLHGKLVREGVFA